MIKNLPGIYIITNKINNKIYIGSTSCFRKRKNQHFSLLKRGKHRNQHLQCSFNKYGEENFEFAPVIYCDKNMLVFYEQTIINFYKPEYNINPCANGRLGARFSDESKEKMRKAQLGKILSKEHREKISAAEMGKIVSEETKEKQSGENNGRAKLTWENVNWIRDNKNNYSQKELSKMFLVDVKQINNIINYRSWKKKGQTC